MKKIAFVINGKGGVGKDTLCNFAANHYKVLNVSSVDPIKKIASENGWKGEKTPEARNFLAELKRVFTEYNDLPTTYCANKYEEFLKSDYDIFFVHIREGEQITHFKEVAELRGGKINTLLITSDRALSVYGNASDDKAEDYDYDFTYKNHLPLDKAEDDFIKYLNSIIKDNGFEI